MKCCMIIFLLISSAVSSGLDCIEVARRDCPSTFLYPLLDVKTFCRNFKDFNSCLRGISETCVQYFRDMEYSRCPNNSPPGKVLWNIVGVSKIFLLPLSLQYMTTNSI
ncbi:uncharacterized protein LOC128249758 isoform X1 [Octopus bimaculoides]|uniref:uncharacterized protein LOC128249758 isoform X1 n=1 Tax=Octopus bimaculoides TaxID=37653 RepID=UPI0022E90764|nr:uncharacterized protein LOC128249758 isoform X1 [Octopus bimaculoides]